jgi:peptidoglycan/xylan/chitin deacetylase (PgdA/CDA1 family)
MLTLQDKMNTKVNPAWLTAGYPYLRAAMIEGVEGIEHHGWKWWKAQQMDLPQLQMELVDIWHFALSDYLLKTQGNINDAADIIEQQLNTPSTQLTFDEQKYNFKALALLDNIQLLVGLCAANRFDTALFDVILSQCEMNSDALYKQYVGKNVLNFFRQDNGYKDGTYIKIWHGKEDNEYLVEALNNLDVNHIEYAELIYSFLSDNYPQ